MPPIRHHAVTAPWACCVMGWKSVMPVLNCASLNLSIISMPRPWHVTSRTFAVWCLSWCIDHTPQKQNWKVAARKPKNGASIWCCLSMACLFPRWSLNLNSSRLCKTPLPNIKKRACRKTPTPTSLNPYWALNEVHWYILPWVSMKSIWPHTWQEIAPFSCPLIKGRMTVVQAMMHLKTKPAMPQIICGMKF